MNFELNLDFPEVDAARSSRVALLAEQRALNESRAKHTAKLEASQKIAEEMQAAYARAVSAYSAGELSQQEAEESLRRRDDAKRVLVLAQDAVAVLDHQRAELTKQVRERVSEISTTFERSATAWFREAWPGIEQRTFSAIEDCAVAILIAGKTADQTSHFVGDFVLRVMSAACARANNARRRIETGKEEAKNREAA